MSNFGLDPMNYYTTPGMAWDCLLKFSRVELEPITDPNTFISRSKLKGCYGLPVACYGLPVACPGPFGTYHNMATVL